MTSVLDPFGLVDAQMSRMRRREPILRAVLARTPSFRDVDEVPVTAQEYDILRDGEELPHGHAMTIMGKPVVVREQPP